MFSYNISGTPVISGEPDMTYIDELIAASKMVPKRPFVQMPISEYTIGIVDAEGWEGPVIDFLKLEAIPPKQ